MAAVQQEQDVDWQAEVIDLKRKGLESKDIAEAVGKHAATVRKVIARAREDGTLQPEEQMTVDDFVDEGTELKAINEAMNRDPIEGQATVDDFTEPTPEEIAEDMGIDPVRDPLKDFRAEAGEAVGEMQTRPGEEPAGVLEPDEALPVMPGTRQLALDLGPNAAPVHEATVTFKSEKWPSGFFGMGDVVTGTFTARIVNVPARERFDKDSEEFRAQPVAYGALITEIAYEAVNPDE